MMEVIVTTVMVVVTVNGDCDGDHDSCDENDHDDNGHGGNRFEIFYDKIN